MFSTSIMKTVTATILCCLVIVVSAIPAPKDTPNSSSCNECVCGVKGRNHRIVGGKVSNAHEYPWLAGLYRQGKVYCGASIISRNYLLTAAHCLEGFSPADIRIYIGGHNLTRDYTELRRVKRVIAHEYFDIFTFNNDIALLEIDRPLNFGPTVQSACLPDGSTQDFAERLSIIAGWGRTDEKLPPSQILREVVVPVWSQAQCMEAGYGNKRITGNMMCAGYHDGKKDACQGDSGGPMHIEGVTGSMEIVGLVSWGRGCARPNLPGIYTRVVNYLDWIKKQMGDECMCTPKIGQRSNYLENLVAKSKSTN